jgi:hypothetical protein
VRRGENTRGACESHRPPKAPSGRNFCYCTDFGFSPLDHESLLTQNWMRSGGGDQTTRP